MNKWKKIETENNCDTWKSVLELFPKASPFQSFEWGESYRGLGWSPLYFGCFDDDENPISAALVLTRRLPLGIGFAWCPGGPAGEAYGEEIGLLPEAVTRAGNFRGLFFRGRFDKKLDINDSIRLTAEGWHRSIFSMGSNYSIELDLRESKEKLAEKLSSKWRRNLRLARENGLLIKCEINPDTAELRKMYEEMEKHKGLGVLCSEEKLENIFGKNHANIIYLACRDEDDNLLGFRSAIFQGKNAVDYLAATSLQGRDRRASFLMMWELLKHCRSIGITSYDMGGIDPVSNPGVYRFKNGTGGIPVEFLGEWDWASSNWLRYAGNLLLAKKQGFAGKAPEKVGPKRRLADLYAAAARIFSF